MKMNKMKTKWREKETEQNKKVNKWNENNQKISNKKLSERKSPYVSSRPPY